jgi:uncharacterized coiled-coil protein SlyX
MNGLNELIADHPAAVVLVFLVGNTILAFLYGTLRWFVKREFTKLDIHQSKQDRDIEKMQKDLADYKLHFAVSQKSFDDLVEKIDRHIEKEDETVRKIDNMSQRLANVEGMLKRNGYG